MDTSDFVELGAGLAFGGMMSRAIGNAFTDALGARTSIKVIAVPQSRAEIQMLLDKLDVQLANGKMSEATYKMLTEKWNKRLDASET